MGKDKTEGGRNGPLDNDSSLRDFVSIECTVSK